MGSTSLYQNHVYRFIVDPNPQAYTYTATVQDLTANAGWSSGTLNFRETTTKSTSYLNIGMTLGASSDNDQFSFDVIDVTGPNLASAPSGLTAVQSASSQINLNWQWDNSHRTSYTIERSLDGNNWTPIRTDLDPNVTSYSDTAVTTTPDYYQVWAINEAGSAKSATVNASTMPRIATNPTNQSVNLGQNVTFSAAAVANPSASVQWQQSTDGGATFANINGATNTTYRFTTIANQNGYQYRAVFTNSLGSATTSAATLTVFTAPSITTQPTDQSALVGQAVTLTAAASGNPTPTVQWQVSTDGGNTFSNISGATNATYVFTASIDQNTNQYRAVFTNSAGSTATSPATLLVSYNIVTVSTMSQLAAAIQAATSGDTILLADGTYAGSLDLTGKSDITIQAANLVQVAVDPNHQYGQNDYGPWAHGGNVVINATGYSFAIAGGTNITLKGITVDGCTNAVQQPAVNVGNGWNLQDCIVQNCNTLGVGGEFNNVNFTRVYTQRNGYMGFGSGSANGQTRLQNITVTDCGTFHNNRGWATNVFGGYGVIGYDGLWHVDPNFEAGGGKWCFLNGATFNRYWADGNGGPGLWFDAPNANVTMSNLKATNNVEVVNPWDGMGIEVEICVIV